MRWNLTCSAFALSIILLGSGSAHAAVSDFEVFSYDLKNDGGTAEMPGRLYIPPGIPAGEKRPLVLFFHGAAERSTDNQSQVNSNINGLLEAAKARGFFLFAPQLDAGSWSAAKVDVALGMVQKATRTHAIDTSKLYVTGISLGGGGAKVAIANYRDVFAAAVPLSAVNYADNNPSQLAGKPIWLFHSVNDASVGVADSDNYANAIRTAAGKSAWTFPDPTKTGAPYYPYDYEPLNQTVNAHFYDEDNLRYSRYTSGGHATKEWTKYYREPWLMDWMLQQQNPITSPKANDTLLFDLGATALNGQDSENRTWNATVADEEQTLETAVPFARFSDGVRSSVSLRVTDEFVGTSSRGLTTGSPFAAAVAQDGWTVSTDDPGSIVIEGLVPDQLYTLTIFGSDSDSDGGRGRMTRYAIGDVFRDLEIFNNLNGTVVFDGVMADASGRMTLAVSVAPGGTARFGGINSLQVTALPEPGSIALLAAASFGLLQRRRHTRIA
jgi:predicted esterase